MEPAVQPWEKHLHPVNLSQQITKMVLVVPRCTKSLWCADHLPGVFLVGCVDAWCSTMHLLLTISGCEAQNPTRHPAAWPKPKLARHGALPAGGDGHLQVTWNFFGFGSKEIRKSNERYKKPSMLRTQSLEPVPSGFRKHKNASHAKYVYTNCSTLWHVWKRKSISVKSDSLSGDLAIQCYLALFSCLVHRIPVAQPHTLDRADEVEHALSQLHQFKEDGAGGSTDRSREGRNEARQKVRPIFWDHQIYVCFGRPFPILTLLSKIWTLVNSYSGVSLAAHLFLFSTHSIVFRRLASTLEHLRWPRFVSLLVEQQLRVWVRKNSSLCSVRLFHMSIIFQHDIDSESASLGISHLRAGFFMADRSKVPEDSARVWARQGSSWQVSKKDMTDNLVLNARAYYKVFGMLGTCLCLQDCPCEDKTWGHALGKFNGFRHTMRRGISPRLAH